MIGHGAQCFSVYDSAAKLFLEPFQAPTVESAIRSFREAINKPGHQFAKFPEDYTLFHIGAFDAEKGVHVPLATPHSLGVAITFMPRAGQLEVASNA